MDKGQYEELFYKKTKELESIITSFLPKEEGYQKTVLEAMNYSIKAGGKRLRPLFMLETFLLFSYEDSLKGEAAKILAHFLASIEMIHTYSLVHDDLPAMDNDLLRRGMPTTHAKYGEAMGILAGDALLNFAFETAADAFSKVTSMNYAFETQEGMELYRRIAKAMQILARHAGIYGMVGGQTADVLNSGKTADLEELNFIYELKTSALLQASFLIGGVLGGAADEELIVLSEVAKNIGMAFQIQDDILDVTGKEEEIGKPVHSDEKNEKTTYITILSEEGAAKEVEDKSKYALKLLSDLLIENKNLLEKDFLENLILELITRKK